MARISKRAVDALKPVAREYFLWDDQLAGFGVKVTPAGRKVYVVQYRVGGRRGRTRRITIGRHGAVTPDRARSEAKRLLGEVLTGRDPAEHRDLRKADATVDELLDRFLTEHVEAKRKPSTAREYRRLLRHPALATLRRRPVRSINRNNVGNLHQVLRCTPYQANRLLAVLSKFFNWCESVGYREEGSNPCRYVEKYPESKRERFLSEEELKRLGQVLIEVEATQSDPPWVIAAIRLLILTGARLSEILTLKWDYVDLENLHLRLPDSKTGRKSIYLNQPAAEVLRQLPTLTGNPYVICGREGRHLVNLNKAWRRIRTRAGLEDVRIHDLRHSFASVAAAGGISLPVIGALLGHAQPHTTARYAHLSADPLKAASDVIGRRIASAMESRNARASARDQFSIWTR